MRASLGKLSIRLRACGLSDGFVSYVVELILGCDWLGRLIPVKLRPNTSCPGGRSSFGVVVLVMESLDRSMPGSFAMASSSDCML